MMAVDHDTSHELLQPRSASHMQSLIPHGLHPAEIRPQILAPGGSCPLMLGRKSPTRSNDKLQKPYIHHIEANTHVSGYRATRELPKTSFGISFYQKSSQFFALRGGYPGYPRPLRVGRRICVSFLKNAKTYKNYFSAGSDEFSQPPFPSTLHLPCHFTAVAYR